MILAEVGIETIAGGTVTGMLMVIMVAMLRRTKDTDERQDEMARVLAVAAVEREARAWAERDRILIEVDNIRVEMREYYEGLIAEERIRHAAELERERARRANP